MKYRYLGNSGLAVSQICLGTMTFGTAGWGCEIDDAQAIVDQFIENGGNFIDTADLYAGGKSEQMLGTVLARHRRNDLVIATKGWFRTRPGVNTKGLSRKHLMEAVHDSLQRMNLDYIDLYQLHGPDPHTPFEETARAIEDLIRAGKILYLGCSNFYGWQIVKFNAIADQLGTARFISGQHLYNLLRRDIEREILPACHDQGMGMICWSPLASGLLSGKYDRSGPSQDSRVGRRAAIDVPRYWNDQSFDIIDEVVRVAKKVGKTPSQVALAWLLQDQRIASVIVGVKNAEQVREAMQVGDWELEAELRHALSEHVPFPLGYPDDWARVTWHNTQI